MQVIEGSYPHDFVMPKKASFLRLRNHRLSLIRLLAAVFLCLQCVYIDLFGGIYDRFD